MFKTCSQKLIGSIGPYYFFMFIYSFVVLNKHRKQSPLGAEV